MSAHGAALRHGVTTRLQNQGFGLAASRQTLTLRVTLSASQTHYLGTQSNQGQ